jgi:hypothetical protein
MVVNVYPRCTEQPTLIWETFFGLPRNHTLMIDLWRGAWVGGHSSHFTLLFR